MNLHVQDTVIISPKGDSNVDNTLVLPRNIFEIKKANDQHRFEKADSLL